MKIKIIAIVAILVVALSAWQFWPRENVTNQVRTSTVYTNSDFRFQIYKPNYALVQAITASQDQVSCCGRVGSVRIPIKGSDTYVYISVYKNHASLEKDHSGGTNMDDTFKQIGLNKTVRTINGKQIPVYYGQHIADVPGGGDSWPDVQAVFIGSIYSYLVDIVNISSDPNNPEVLLYLNSFKAN